LADRHTNQWIDGWTDRQAERPSSVDASENYLIHFVMNLAEKNGIKFNSCFHMSNIDKDIGYL